MRWLHKESLRYAMLLVVLLSIASIAVLVMLGYLENVIPDQQSFAIVTMAIWALTMGFMLIAGAFGLWAISFAAETESLRRLSSLIDAMDYIHDAVIGLDFQGNVTGLNPAAIETFGDSIRHQSLSDIFPSLKPDDITRLTTSKIPIEIETVVHQQNQQATLRLRSQPSKGIILLLISDVTELVQARDHSRRNAYIQLIGHMAKGLANDFNNLLCGIAGHASLLQSQNKTPPNDSLQSIMRCADRGILMARQLLQLSESVPSEITATFDTANHIKSGISQLRASLPDDWDLTLRFDKQVPPVDLPAAQLENIVHSIGLVAADAVSAHRHINIDLKGLDESDALSPAGVTLTFTTIPADEPRRISRPNEENGIVLSVIDTLLSEVGGKLESATSPNGEYEWKLTLPSADLATIPDDMPEMLIQGLAAYAADWHIAIDGDIPASERYSRRLEGLGMHVASLRGIGPLLGMIESDARLDAIIVGMECLGQDARPLLKAIGKLAPRTGIVVFCSDAAPAAMPPGIVTLKPEASLAELIQATIEARGKARSKA